MSKAQTLYSISNEIKTMISKHELDMIIHPFVSPHLDDCSSLFHSSKQRTESSDAELCCQAFDSHKLKSTHHPHVKVSSLAPRNVQNTF